MTGDDRSNALKQRLAKNKTADTEDTSVTEDTSKTAGKRVGDSDAKAGDTQVGERVKDRVNVNMYLPEELAEELQERFKVINAQRTIDGKDELEKNRDFYPALVRAGLDNLEDYLPEE